jgi:hypothetical protein
LTFSLVEDEAGSNGFMTIKIRRDVTPIDPVLNELSTIAGVRSVDFMHTNWMFLIRHDGREETRREIERFLRPYRLIPIR